MKAKNLLERKSPAHFALSVGFALLALTCRNGFFFCLPIRSRYKYRSGAFQALSP